MEFKICLSIVVAMTLVFCCTEAQPPIIFQPGDASVTTSSTGVHLASILLPPPCPAGAATLGYTTRVINEHPVAADIALGKKGDYKWFSGLWYMKKPLTSYHYVTTNGILMLTLGDTLASVSHNFSPGILPLLPGDKGFYVEFDVRLSDNDPDHWPAVWLMPVEHDDRYGDCYPGDPAGFERWTEIDVDEGGFGPGITSTVHAWAGIHTNYQNLQNPNNVSKVALNRSRKHTFGASYDPASNKVTWYLDGCRQQSAGAPYVSKITSQEHFYLIISVQSRGKHKPYSMYVSGVRAYVPPGSPLSAK